MSVNYDLAVAACRVRALNERLPEQHQADITAARGALLGDIEYQSAAQARRLIDEWTTRMEERLSCALLNAPLEVERS